jgi:hypothetical protein
MGIRGLGKYIKWKLPSVRKRLDFSVHAGETWGIDISCILYRANGASLQAITVVASLLVRMRRARITPIIIFDGKTTTAKSEVVEQRRAVRAVNHRQMEEIRAQIASGELGVLETADAEKRCADLQKKSPVVTNGEKDELKKFLYAAGVLFVTASGEADDMLAYMCREGVTTAVISTDMDMLARGVPRLLIPETNDTSVLTDICLADVLQGLDLEYRQFVNACALMGTDYSGAAWNSVEPSHAITMARGSLDWNQVDPSGCCLKGIDILMGSGVTLESILGTKQREKWISGAGALEPDNLAAVAATYRWPMVWAKTLCLG